MGDELLRLAERVEEASGADRELDAAIALACVPEFAGWVEHPANNGNQWGELAPSREAFDEWLIRDGEPCLMSVLAYTASLDAALTLVPSGWAYGAGVDFLVTGPPGWAWVTNEEDYQLVRAATPALALTAAALRARAAIQEKANG